MLHSFLTFVFYLILGSKWANFGVGVRFKNVFGVCLYSWTTFIFLYSLQFLLLILTKFWGSFLVFGALNGLFLGFSVFEICFGGLLIMTNNFAFLCTGRFKLESTIPDGRRPVRRSAGRPGLFGTKTNSAKAEAGARAELGNKLMTSHLNSIYT